MQPNTKKYLIGGAVLVGGYLIYLRAKHNAKAEADKPVKKPVKTDAPSTAGQFSPVGLPQTYNPYPQMPYTPSYIPPPGYVPPSYPGAGSKAMRVVAATSVNGGNGPGIFATWAMRYWEMGYNVVPITPGMKEVPPVGYPQYGTTNQAACSSVIGSSLPIARQRLQSLGIYPRVVSINNRPVAIPTLATNGPTANLYVSGSIVVNATCNAGPTYANAGLPYPTAAY